MFHNLCTVNQMQKSMNIENPFIFGRAAEGTYFTDREEDAKRLTANLTLRPSVSRSFETKPAKKCLNEFI